MKYRKSWTVFITALLFLHVFCFRVKVLASEGKYVGFYNGLSSEEAYHSIGIATSADGTTWRKSVLPVLKKRADLFDGISINGPSPVQVGDLIYVYYAAYDGIWNAIGLAIYDQDLNCVTRPRQPVLTLGSQEKWDDSKIYRPVVLYNPNSPNPNRRFAMLYDGGNSEGINQTGLAYSENGIAWNKFEGNPVMTTGPVDSWDSRWVFPDSVIYVGGAYCMAYNGYDGVRIQTGIAISPSLEGPWLKCPSNPVLKSRPDAKQVITIDAPTGSLTIKVNDSSVFEIDESCFISSTGKVENVRVKSKPDVNTVSLYQPLNFTHTVSENAYIVSMLAMSVGPNQLQYDGQRWTLYGSAWGAVQGYETTTFAEGDCFSALQWQYKKMPVLNYDTFSADWDSKSQENLKFIQIKN